MRDQQEYRGIMKGIVIFGGVQVFTLLVNILRGKFIAVFLGPAGMGIYSMFASTTNTITQATNLGLNMGVVRDISMANENGDVVRVAKIARIFRRLAFATGMVAALVSIVGAKWLSLIAFGDEEYRIAFIILGAMLLFGSLASAETSILQGMRQLRNLAQASLIGYATGLVVGVPLYYFFGNKGIAPSMVAFVLATYISNRYFVSKTNLPKTDISTKETTVYFKSIILLGIAMSVCGLLGALSTYFINWFIRYSGDIADVGLYQAASSITTQYIGFVFSAMAIDYYPRLAAKSSNNRDVRRLVNHQAEIVILIATPIIIALLATIPLIVRILLSKEFMSAIPVIRWMGLALFFRATSYALGYVSFAKGDKKVFFWMEAITSNGLNVACAVIGYLFWGLTGLGIGVLMNFIGYLIVISIVANKRYNFRYSREFIRLFIVQFVFCIVAFSVSLAINNYIYSGIICGTILVVSCLLSFKELNNKMSLVEMLKNKFGK